MADEGRDSVWKEMSDVRTSVLKLDARVDKIEARVDGELKGMAPKDWVHNVLTPIQQSITRMEGVVEVIGTRATEVFDEHKRLLKETGERERQEWAEKSAQGMVKRYGPVVALLVGLVFLFRVLGTALEAFISSHK